MAALDFPAAPSINDTYTANGKTWRWNGSSWIGGHGGTSGDLSPVIVRVRRTTDFTVAAAGASPVIPQWDTQDEDTDSMWEGVTNPGRVTINSAGLYHINCQIVWASHAAAGTHNVYLLVNGSEFTDAEAANSAGKVSLSYTAYQVTDFLDRFAQTDYCQIGLFQNTGATRTISSGTDVPLRLTAVRIAL
jgi:hypothetical protein